MNRIFIIKIVVFVAAIIASRVILARAGRRLTDAERETIAANSRGLTVFRNVLVFGTAIFLMILENSDAALADSLKPYVFAVMCVGMASLVFLSWRAMRRLNISAAMQKAYLLSVGVLAVGIVVLLLPV